MQYKQYDNGTSNVDELMSRIRWMPNGKGVEDGKPLHYKPVDVDSEEYQSFISNPANKHLIVSHV